MAFSYEITKTINAKNGKTVLGNFSNDSGSTGGEISLPLIIVHSMNAINTGGSLGSGVACNETFPVAGKSSTSITIITGADENGTFQAYGV